MGFRALRLEFVLLTEQFGPTRVTVSIIVARRGGRPRQYARLQTRLLTLNNVVGSQLHSWTIHLPRAAHLAGHVSLTPLAEQSLRRRVAGRGRG